MDNTLAMINGWIRMCEQLRREYPKFNINGSTAMERYCMETCAFHHGTCQLCSKEWTEHICSKCSKATRRDKWTSFCKDCADANIDVDILASEDYPWGGSIEPYDAEMENEILNGK